LKKKNIENLENENYEQENIEYSAISTENPDRSDKNEFENPLRPRFLHDYIGQKKVKENLSVFINAAKIRGETLDHVLLYGPPGLGKTTLSMIIAAEMGVGIKITSGPAISHAGDLSSILTNLGAGDVLFMDEIHRIPRVVEEILYPAMEDFSIDVVIGKGQMANSIHLPLEKFTLVGATTRAGQLGAPFRDRFGVVLRLDMYSQEELEQIIIRSASILDIKTTKEGAEEIARRSRGTPRIANRLLKRVRDFAQVKNNGEINLDIVNYALERLEVDELGLEANDRRILEAIIKFYGGGPVGIETLAAAVGEEAVTIEDIYEPYLLKIGFLARTTRGRIATKLAYSYLGIEYHKKVEQLTI
jgi:Holliday junction DNA helicase RuvB